MAMCCPEAMLALRYLIHPATEGAAFPPTSCNAWEDCKHDGICHDPDGCGAVGPNCSTTLTKEPEL